MYQALYRKWRPKVFDDVIGQEHITETLKTQVRTGHLYRHERNRQNHLRENSGQGSQLREPGEREPLQQMPVLQRD